MAKRKRKPGPKRDLAKAYIMGRLRAEGWTLAKIGQEFGISRQRVHQTLANDGIGAWAAAAHRSRQKPGKKKRDLTRAYMMGRLRAEGWTLAKIGQEFGISRQCVQQTLANDGISAWAAVAYQSRQSRLAATVAGQGGAAP